MVEAWRSLTGVEREKEKRYKNGNFYKYNKNGAGDRRVWFQDRQRDRVKGITGD